jgi:hypothetical protein
MLFSGRVRRHPDRLPLLFCLFFAAISHACADDTFHNIYHSLKRFFTGKHKHSSVTVRRRHSSGSHPDSHSASNASDMSGNHAPKPRAVVLPETAPVPDSSGAKAEQRKSTDTAPPEKGPADAKPVEPATPDIKFPATGLDETKADQKKPGEVNNTGPPGADSSPVLRSIP